MSVRTARRQNAFSLVEILVVIVVMVVLAAVLFPRIAGNSRTPAGKAATPMARTHDVECQVNIRQVRQSIEALKAGDPDGKPAASLADLRLPGELTRCAVGKEPYQYNPQTGEVHCPHPGHESY